MRVVDLRRIKADYDRDGVVRLPALFEPEELADLRARVDRYQREIAPGAPAGDVVYEADQRAIRNLFHMEANDPTFAAFAMQSRLTELASTLVNGEALLWGVETFNKPARVGSIVPWHQDNAYFCQTPADIFSLWIALDPATAENGAVRYLKGSHHAAHPHEPSGVKGNSYGLANANAIIRDFVEYPAELAPGDALAHHGQIIHASEPNRSEKPRLAMVIVYRGSHTRTDEAARETYQAAMRATMPG